MTTALPQAVLSAAQRPTPPAKPKKSFLATITTGVVESPWFIFLYGVPGIGKTTFAAGAPDALFLDLQKGTTRLNVKRMPGIDTWEDIKSALDELASEEHPFKTLVVDTLDDLELKIWAHVCKRNDWASIGEPSYGKGFDAAFEEWRVFAAKLQRLQSVGMNLIIIGHCKTETFKNPEGEDYDRYVPSIHKLPAGLFHKICTAQLFAQQEVFAKIDKRTKRARGVATTMHVIKTSRTAAYDAKNRDNLPESMALDWADYAAAVAAQAPASPDEVLGEIGELIERIAEGTRPLVQRDIDAAGGNVPALVRILNRLRATVKAAERESAQ